MYTMPKRANEEQLNERVPLSVATWHLPHEPMHAAARPAKDRGLHKVWVARIHHTQETCNAAGGKFHPVVFGWMVHVYPYED